MLASRMIAPYPGSTGCILAGKQPARCAIATLIKPGAIKYLDAAWSAAWVGGSWLGKPFSWWSAGP